MSIEVQCYLSIKSYGVIQQVELGDIKWLAFFKQNSTKLFPMEFNLHDIIIN